jgi:transposase
MATGQTTFEKAFKIEAVRLVKTSGKPLTQLAQDLGVSKASVSRWCQDYGTNGEQAFVGSGHQQPEAEEFKPLRRENDILRQERDRRKKALAIFSRL